MRNNGVKLDINLATSLAVITHKVTPRPDDFDTIRHEAHYMGGESTSGWVKIHDLAVMITT